MLRFCGHDLELTVDVVLERRPGHPGVFSATDGAQGRWLIVEGAGHGADRTWLCAPASTRVVDLVSTRRAQAVDAVRHSLTGWVEVVRVVEGHAVPDRRVACADLDPALLATTLTPA